MTEASTTANSLFNSSHALGPLSGHRDGDDAAVVGNSSPRAASSGRDSNQNAADSLKMSQSSREQGAHGLRYPPEVQQETSHTASKTYTSHAHDAAWSAPHSMSEQEPLANASFSHSQPYNGDTANTYTSYPSSHTKDASAPSGFARQAGRRSVQIFGTPQIGIIGKHKPREIIRIDRDYSDGEICQFWSGYPMELEGRVSTYVQSSFHDIRLI